MKTILFCSLFFLFSCSKEETKNNCKTCTVDVEVTGATHQHYIESITEYCDGTWRDYDGIVFYTSSGLGAQQIFITKKTTCK